MSRKLSAEEHVLRGNYRRSIHGPIPTASKAALPTLPSDPPQHLSQDQQRIWRDKLKELPPNFVPMAQKEVFEAWVVARSQWLEASALIRRDGIVIEGRDSTRVKHPAVVVQDRAFQQIHRVEAILRFNDTEELRRRTPEPVVPWLKPKESA